MPGPGREAGEVPGACHGEGRAPRAVEALAHAGLLEPPLRRPTMVTRAWLAKQCTVRNRALRGISKECGLPVRELRRMAAQWGIPAWTDFDRPLPAPFTSLPQPLAPGLHRVLVSTNGPDNLRLICALPSMPSLSAAERALASPGIRHHLLRIERMVGFTIIERTRPLTATPRGQVFLSRAAQALVGPSEPRSLEYRTRHRPGLTATSVDSGDARAALGVAVAVEEPEQAPEEGRQHSRIRLDPHVA